MAGLAGTGPDVAGIGTGVRSLADRKPAAGLVGMPGSTHFTTGDTNPSAAVADGTSDAQYKADRGDFYSFISGETISVFDFLIAQGLATNFMEAARIVADASGVPLPQFDPEGEDNGGGSAVAEMP